MARGITGFVVDEIVAVVRAEAHEPAESELPAELLERLGIFVLGIVSVDGEQPFVAIDAGRILSRLLI